MENESIPFANVSLYCKKCGEFLGTKLLHKDDIKSNNLPIEWCKTCGEASFVDRDY